MSLSLIPSFLPRSLMDVNFLDFPLNLRIPTSLESFDPFDEIDRMLGRNISWLTVPSDLMSVLPVIPQVPEKYRVSLTCPGFSEDSITTQVKDNKLLIKGCEGNAADKQKGDYMLHEMQKSFDLPKNVDADNLVSFMIGDNLVVEMPLKQKGAELQLPVIADAGDGAKKVELNVKLPENIDPSKVTVTCKDRDLIVKADYREQKEDSDTKVYYLRRSTLPLNTDWNSLKCTADKHNLRIEAGLGPDQTKSIPIKIENLPQQSIQEQRRQAEQSRQQQSGQQLSGQQQREQQKCGQQQCGQQQKEQQQQRDQQQCGQQQKGQQQSGQEQSGQEQSGQKSQQQKRK